MYEPAIAMPRVSYLSPIIKIKSGLSISIVSQAIFMALEVVYAMLL